jgi:hypothetical protein
MNGDAKRNVALGVIALGIGAALGAVLGNDKTRKSITDRSKNWFSNLRQLRL